MNRIRSLREEMGMTQKELAARIGVKGGAVVSKYENGVNPLPEETLRLLSIIFGASIDYILGVSDSRKPGTSMSQPHMDWDVYAFVESMNALSPEERQSVLAFIRSPEAREASEKYSVLASRSKKKALDYMEMLKVMEDVRPLREDL